MAGIQKSLKELLKYPSAVVGLILTLLMIALAVYALIAIPYDEAVRLWRGGEGVWYTSPRIAQPIWTNWFSATKQPESFAMKISDENVTRVDGLSSSGFKEIQITYDFDYQADGFPSELALYFATTPGEKEPFVSVTWLTPDGREIEVVDMGLGVTETYFLDQDTRLTRRLGRREADVGLFLPPDTDPEIHASELEPLKGPYQMVINGRTFEEGSDIIEAEFVLYGKVSGMAGTDHHRRDLMISLIWGAPIALSFGLLASLGISIFTIIISAVGTWFGGLVDSLIQRATEVNLTLPFLSILIMVGTFYSKSLWVILGVTVLLSIFGAQIKAYRAIFLQVKESTYIEAAQAYGASNMRIIFRYLIPRIIPLIIPNLVLSVPTFVFLEATLAQLGLGDPVLPTWGKVIYDAAANAAVYNGQYYWILEPAILLSITGLAFALVGFSLDRIFNPRLRTLE
jgi:peptide/nickel transport system permease protein